MWPYEPMPGGAPATSVQPPSIPPPDQLPDALALRITRIARRHERPCLHHTLAGLGHEHQRTRPVELDRLDQTLAQLDLPGAFVALEGKPDFERLGEQLGQERDEGRAVERHVATGPSERARVTWIGWNRRVRSSSVPVPWWRSKASQISNGSRSRSGRNGTKAARSSGT